jgi:carotenoid 1,2-hydratase
MTERGQRQVHRSAARFDVGPSSLEWTGQSLLIDIDERSAPLRRPVLGQVRVQPLGLSTFQTPLDAAGRHRWGPIAPCARVEVDLEFPPLRWRGHAYVDSNEGDEPIERAFSRWNWLRAPLADDHCAVTYDAESWQGPRPPIGARFRPDGRSEPLELKQSQILPSTRIWRLARQTPTQAASPRARVHRTLEDTPFYARSLLRMTLEGQATTAMHESLDVRRLVTPAVQWMLPWRMPRVP